MPVEQFLKDRQQAALEVMGTGFVIGHEVVLTCAHVFDDLADELRRKKKSWDDATVQFVFPVGPHQ